MDAARALVVGDLSHRRQYDPDGKWHVEFPLENLQALPTPGTGALAFPNAAPYACHGVLGS
jgi:hypothetical protein